MESVNGVIRVIVIHAHLPVTIRNLTFLASLLIIPRMSGIHDTVHMMVSGGTIDSLLDTANEDVPGGCNLIMLALKKGTFMEMSLSIRALVCLLVECIYD